MEVPQCMSGICDVVCAIIILFVYLSQQQLFLLLFCIFEFVNVVTNQLIYLEHKGWKILSGMVWSGTISFGVCSVIYCNTLLTSILLVAIQIISGLSTLSGYGYLYTTKIVKIEEDMNV